MTTILEIHPNEGIGDIHFGMSRNAVREILGGEIRSFRKSPTSVSLADVFEGRGIYAYYDERDLIEAVELAAPAAPTLNMETLIGRPYAELKERIRNLDPDLEEDGAGLTALAIGLGLYAPQAKKNAG